tara:strand:+ start:166 stop:582 length:417 start_codon:yes stop_codon:yes gene_type:complete
MNTITVELDAYEIAEKLFIKNSEINKNFTIENVDIKTFFEMLLIITMEGLKKFHGNEDNTVNLSSLSEDDLKNINFYLEKINIKLNLRLIDHVSWNVFSLEKVILPYDKIELNENTPLNKLNCIISNEYVYVINFDYI